MHENYSAGVKLLLQLKLEGHVQESRAPIFVSIMAAGVGCP